MLFLYTRDGKTGAAPADLKGAALPADIVWIDLVAPEPDEIALVERSAGLALPTFEALSEIETSSRVRMENGAIYLSAPLVRHADDKLALATPVGFVLTRERLITVRFAPLDSFTAFIQSLGRPGAPHASAAEIFSGLMAAIVDRLADVLESIAAELDVLSHRAFHAGPISERPHLQRPREEAGLRDILRRVGSNGDLASKIRDSLLGVARIVPYVGGQGADWLSPEVKAQLESMRYDISSLSDYDAHLVNKVQLLLDATLGLINIEQNNIIKVLTIVSVVGVPPTLVASMYGMNFRHMPELDWAWGYPYGLALIALSAVLPLLWFKWRGWF